MPVAPAGAHSPSVLTVARQGTQTDARCTATEVATFVGLRQCGRYLRLTHLSKLHASRSSGAEEPQQAGRARQIDASVAAAGHRLEAQVAAELRQCAPSAPHGPQQGSFSNETPWRAFLSLLAQAIGPCDSGPVGCWAEEVALCGLPTADSVVSVNGRADFIVLLWRGGRPVLRIVECKASAETQTKHLVQLVLYRMLVLRLLQEEASVCGGRVLIGDRAWAVPKASVAAAAAAAGDAAGRGRADAAGFEGEGIGEVGVECVLRNKAPGAAVAVVEAEALAAEEVASMTRSLAALLAPGGRIATALDPATPPHRLPFEMDTHCAQCARAPACWADAAARGAVQLAGCTSHQAQRLAAAGVRDIEDLAELADLAGGGGGGGSGGGSGNGKGCSGGRGRSAGRQGDSSSSSLCHGRSLADVASASGIPRAELERLAVTAGVRAQRRLGPSAGATGGARERPQRQQQPPQHALLPGAPPSWLPDSTRGPLVGVFLSVAVDAVLKRVVGIAAHVAMLGQGEDGGGGAGGGGGRAGGGRSRQTAAPAAAPAAPRAGQSGWDVVCLLRGVRLDDSGVEVESSDGELDELERCTLERFSHHLCQAIGNAAAAAPAPPLHFYVHYKAELQALIQRCVALDCGAAASESATATATGGGSYGGGGLVWLPHLLGMRAGAGEQDMVSCLDGELARYATVWQGAGRTAATSIDWGRHGSAYDWRVPAVDLPAAGAAAAGAAAVAAAAGSGWQAADSQAVDLRALFSAGGGGYMDCLQPFDPQRHRALGEPAAERPAAPALAAQQQQQGLHQSRGHSGGCAGQVQVQVRPDLPGSSIPPSYFRALWQAEADELTERPAHPGSHQPGYGQHPGYPWGQQQPHQQPQRQGRRPPDHAIARGAAHLGALLLAQARGVRWLEDRLARLPLGCNPSIAKTPLPLPLGPALLAFRLDSLPPRGGGSGFGPRIPPAGAHVPLATELARAGVDATRMNRAAEVAQFWGALAAQPPAARAAQGRSGGTLVLGRVAWVTPPDKRAGWLSGRVLYPEGCGSWEALCEATGLGKDPDVLVSEAADPWVRQDAGRVAQRCAVGALRPDSRVNVDDSGSEDSEDASQSSGAGSGSSGNGANNSGAGLWVEVHVDFKKYPTGDGGLFVLGTCPLRSLVSRPSSGTGSGAAGRGALGLAPAAALGLAPAATPGQGPVLVLDAAPNISAWVTSSVVEALQEYGTSSAYLAERLALPPLQLPPPPQQRQQQQKEGHLDRALFGDVHGTPAPAAPPAAAVSCVEALAEPRTPPPASRTVPGAACGAGEVTPASVLGAQELLSPASPASTSTPVSVTSPPAHCSPLTPGHRHQRSRLAAAAQAARAIGPAAPAAVVQDSVGGVRGARGVGGGGVGGTRGGTGGAGLRPNDEEELARRFAACVHLDLHPDQLACVRAFLSHPGAGPRVLLHGPPGTGKTETLAAALLAWLAARLQRGGPMGPPEAGGVVLISGPTHTAIDTVMDRVAMRLTEAGRAAAAAGRVKLLRLAGRNAPLSPLQKQAGTRLSVPSRGKTGDWYVVGGTLRHLVKTARQLRTLAAGLLGSHSAAGRRGLELMEASGRGAFAAALLLDEASMVFGPQLLALGSLVVTRGSLLVGGDPQQLGSIVAHDFGSELRPNLLRHAPHVSAYEYLRRLAAAQGAEAAGEWRISGGGGAGGGGSGPPPVAVCALTYTHRLPAAVTQLISPLYRRAGVELRGRPPAPRGTTGTSLAALRGPPPPQCAATPGPVRRQEPASVAAVGAATGASVAVTAAYSTCVAGAAAGGSGSSSIRISIGSSPRGGASAAPSGRGALGAGVWRRLWGGEAAGEAASEGVFLLVHNEEGSSQLNPVELQIVCEVMRARPPQWGGGGGSGGAAAAAGEQAERRGRDGGTAVGSALGAKGADGPEGGRAGERCGVAIITPHRAQRRALQALAAETGWGCRAETVERMQGGEADTVIFSATVSDPAALDRSPDFYASLCRANVAFSRTRARLIVVASRAFLSHLPPSHAAHAGMLLWRQLSLLCEERGVYLGEAAVRARVPEAVQAQEEAGGDGRQRDGTVVTYRCDVFGSAV